MVARVNHEPDSMIGSGPLDTTPRSLITRKQPFRLPLGFLADAQRSTRPVPLRLAGGRPSISFYRQNEDRQLGFRL